MHASGEALWCKGLPQTHTLYSDPNIKGQKVFPGWPVGAEAEGLIAVARGVMVGAHVGCYKWIVRDNQPPDFRQFSEAFFRYLAEPKKKPNLELSDLDFERNPPRLDWIRETLNATDTDLSAFRARGGKLLMWFGWTDPALNPPMGIEYYEAVGRKTGGRHAEFLPAVCVARCIPLLWGV